MEDTEEIIYSISDKYNLNWGVDAEISILSRYIANQDSWDAFVDFVEQVAQEEAAHTIEGE